MVRLRLLQARRGLPARFRLASGLHDRVVGGLAMMAPSQQRSRRWLFGIAFALVAAVGPAHWLEAQTPKAPLDVNAVGCVTQTQDAAAAPSTAHEQGAAKGLTLSRATLKLSDGRAVGTPPRSAVPGSLPEGGGSGSTDVTAGRAPVPVEQSFWLVGAKSGELTRFVGKRVEVTGTMDDRQTPNPGTPAVTDTGSAAARRAATAPPEPPVTAHPSAPSRSISVLSFRVVGEGCR
jgi:hypothetical protein